MSEEDDKDKKSKLEAEIKEKHETIFDKSQTNPKGALIDAISLDDKYRPDQLVQKIIDYNPGIVNDSINDRNYTPLIFAVLKHKVYIVDYLLTITDIDINKTLANGNTALIVACDDNRDKNIEIVEALILNLSINMNKLNNDGISALHKACINKYSDFVELLLDRPILNDPSKDININIKNAKGDTPLMISVFHNDITTIGKLLNVDGMNSNKNFIPANVNEINNAGNTALMIAIDNSNKYIKKENEQDIEYHNYYEILKILINVQDLEINIKNVNKSALVLAVEKNRLDIVKLLIHVPYIYIIDALKKAVELGYIPIIEQLLHIEPPINEDDRTQIRTSLDTFPHSEDIRGQIHSLFATIPISLEFLKAVIQHTEGFKENNETKKSDNMTVIERCLANAALNINITNEFSGCGRTALMEASRAGDIDLVNLLLRKQFDVNTQTTTYGDTALTYAAFNNHENVVIALRDRADPNKKTFLGNTALIIASKEGHGMVVTELLKYPNINLNEQNNNQMTALMMAAYYKRDNIIDLLKNIADINKFTLFGNTAIMYASMKGSHTIVDKLLEKLEIDCNKKTTYGDTALSYAVENNNIEIVQSLLRQPNIEWNTQTLFGKTSLMTAVENKNIPIIQFFLDIPNNLDYIVLTTKNGKTISKFAEDTKNSDIIALINSTRRSIERIKKIMEHISENQLISYEELKAIPDKNYTDEEINKAREQYALQLATTTDTVRNEDHETETAGAPSPAARSGGHYPKTLKLRR